MKSKFEKAISFERAHIFPRKYRNLQNMPHWHREHELIFVQSGCVTVMTDDTPCVLSEGMGAFMHSEEMHSIHSEPGAVVIVAKLDASFFHRITGANRLRTPLLTAEYGLPVFFEKLFAEFKEDLPFAGAIADSIATELVARVFRTEALGTPSNDHRNTTQRFRALLDLIDKNFAYITFTEAADYLHFSKPYFSDYFRARTGMAFSRYLNTVKISFAVEKVLDGTLSVTEISKCCGFNTIRNFNRVFKQLTGYAPSELPKDYRFMHNSKEYADSGFDPTLTVSETLDP